MAYGNTANATSTQSKGRSQVNHFIQRTPSVMSLRSLHNIQIPLMMHRVKMWGCSDN